MFVRGLLTSLEAERLATSGPRSVLWAFSIHRGTMAHGVHEWMSQRDRAELERWVRSPSMPPGLVMRVANKPALVRSETTVGRMR